MATPLDVTLIGCPALDPTVARSVEYALWGIGTLALALTGFMVKLIFWR